MQFVFEAMRPDGGTVREPIEAADRDEAAETLRERGLLLLRLDADDSGEEASVAWRPGGNRVTVRDRILFTRQMKMLLEAGSPVVPALEAAGEQTTKPLMREMIARLCERVEEGDSLAKALEAEKGHFDSVFCSMIAAGEATGSLPQIFGRLSQLAQQQLQTRKLVLGAMLYPIVLCVLLTGVVNVLLLFVVPRFTMLFTSLRTELPATTQMLFTLSKGLREGWPVLLGGLIVAVGGLIVVIRTPAARRMFDSTTMRLPVIGRLIVRLNFARVLRVWAAMLRCHVPLLDAIHQSRGGVTNTVIRALIDRVEESVASGGRMGQAIGAVGLVDPVVASAIRTGEENGRLAEAVDFVSNWLDEDNATLVQSATRLAEPLLLAVMGVIVGFVAMSLFLPLFDLATAA